MKLNRLPEELSKPNFLVFLLFQFPEIFTINYNVAQARFRVSFMLQENVQEERYTAFTQKFQECLEAYRDLQDKVFPIPETSFDVLDSWNMLQITWEKENVSPEDVNLISTLVVEEFNKELIIDKRQGEEFKKEIVLKEDMEEYILSRKTSNKENLFAFREAGKVYVIDR